MPEGDALGSPSVVAGRGEPSVVAGRGEPGARMAWDRGQESQSGVTAPVCSGKRMPEGDALGSHSVVAGRGSPSAVAGRGEPGARMAWDRGQESESGVTAPVYSGKRMPEGDALGSPSVVARRGEPGARVAWDRGQGSESGVTAPAYSGKRMPAGDALDSPSVVARRGEPGARMAWDGTGIGQNRSAGERGDGRAA